MAEKKGFDLAALLGDVSKMDTGAGGRKQLEYLELDRLDPDPRNFYALDGIEELAANIELLGLQQPLTVRVSETDPGRFVVVSGHRRREALLRLAKEDPEKWRLVPCLREEGGSPALQELRLIYANMDTRKMSSADISRQAERVEALLYELKEQGMDFPGRMRDHVAEACKVSRTKLARLKVIREKLIPELKKAWEKNEIAEAVAYALAQQTEEMQRDILAHWPKKLGYLREWDVRDMSKDLNTLNARKCKRGARKGFTCSNKDRMTEKIYAPGQLYAYHQCLHVKCCSECPELAKCKQACPMLADEVKREKERIRKEKAEEKEKKRTAELPVIQDINRYWARWGQAMDRAGLTDEQLMAQLDLGTSFAALYGWNVPQEMAEPLKTGACAATKKETPLPLDPFLNIADARRIVARADALGCSLDYLLCRTDVPEVNTGKEDEGLWFVMAPTQWQTGTPKQEGLYAGRFDCGEGTVLTRVGYYNAEAGIWLFRKGGAAIGVPCVGWVKLPDEEN